jgi:rhodanese-related sulfurtransferase
MTLKIFSASILFLAFFGGSCQAQNPANVLDANQFEKALNDSVQVLDVRRAEEYKTGHIKNALLADWTNQTEFKRRVQYIDKDRPVYVYCLAGGRSAAAANWLRAQGYTRVVELQGGINAWKNAQKSLEGAVAANQPQMTLADFQQKIQPGKTYLVDFGAPWCPPCVKMAPVLDSLEKEMAGKVEIIRIDAGIHTDLMKALGIEALPGLLVYKNQQQTWKHEGVATREALLAQLQ